LIKFMRKYGLILFFVTAVLCMPEYLCSQDVKDLRIIKVTAVFDEEFMDKFDWKREIQNRMDFVSRVFEEEVGIRFEIVGYREWKSDNKINMMQLLLQDLKNTIPKGEGDIVIGFTSQSGHQSHASYDDFIAGLAYSFRDYVLVRTIRSEDWNTLSKYQSLIHEIGHLFGAVHVRHFNSIMQNPIRSSKTLKFDAYNKEIINITKKRDFNRGIESLPVEDINRLIEIYQKMVELNPEEGFPYFYLSMLYSKKRMTNMGAMELRKALRLNKAIAQSYIIPEYRRRIRQNPEDASAYSELAYAYFVNDMLHEAEWYNSVALKINPYMAEAYNNQGLIFLKKGNLEEAIKRFQKALKNYPLYPEAHYNLGRCFYITRNNKEAVREFKKCIELKQDFNEAKIFTGLIFMRENKLDDAILEFRSALFNDPSLLDADKYLGDIYFKKGDYPSALEHYTSVRNMDPEYPLINLAVGKTELKLNRVRRSIYSLKLALKRQPSNAEIHYYLGLAYEREKLLWIALDEYEQAESFDPGMIELHKRLGDLYHQFGKINKSIIEYTIVKQLAPEDIHTRIRLSIIYENQGLINLSIEELKDILNIQPNNGYIHFKLGEAYLKIERYDLADYHCALARELGFSN